MKRESNIKEDTTMGNQQLKHFKDIYYVSSGGNIYSKLKNKPRRDQRLDNKFFINDCWYMKVKISISKKGYRRIKLPIGSFSLARLVAKLFISNPLNFPQVNHKDGNKQNDCVENLEWVTNEENEKHARRIGLKKSINYIKVKNLLENTHMIQKEIAKECDCSPCTIKEYIKKCKVQRPERYKASERTVETRSHLVGTKWFRSAEHSIE